MNKRSVCVSKTHIVVICIYSSHCTGYGNLTRRASVTRSVYAGLDINYGAQCVLMYTVCTTQRVHYQHYALDTFV
jgi:hypothetical protein